MTGKSSQLSAKSHVPTPVHTALSPFTATPGRALSPLRPPQACISLNMLVGLLALTEATLLFLSGCLIWIGYVGLGSFDNVIRYLVAIITGIGIFLVIEYFSGQYSQERLRILHRNLLRAPINWMLTVVILVTCAFGLKVGEDYSRIWLFSWLGTGIILLISNRLIAAFIVKRLASTGLVGERIAILGAGDRGQLLISHLTEHSDPYTKIIGVFDERRAPRVPEVVCGHVLLGGVDDLVAAARYGAIDTVIITLPWSATHRLQHIISALEAVSVDVRLSPGAFGFQIPAPKFHQVAAIPMLSVWDRPIKEWHAVAKWLEDKLIASVALILLGPLMLLIAGMIKLESPGPALFRQLRFGFNNETINVLKFRTMYLDSQDVSGTARTTRNDPRVTRVGRILRRTSLDELPQILNVLKGEMSIVGPRPHALTMKIGNRYYFDAVKGYAARHKVRPGITGWAQVNDLRGEIDSIEKAQNRVKYDIMYVNNWSLAFDLRIIAMTFFALFKTKNAY